MAVTLEDVERALATKAAPTAGSAPPTSAGYRPAAGAAPTHDVDVTFRTAPEGTAPPPTGGVSLADVEAALSEKEAKTPGWRQALRLPALALQGFATGVVLDTLGMPADLLNLYQNAMHKGLQMVGVNLPQPAQVPGGSQQLTQLATETVPDVLGMDRPIQPETGAERIVARGARLAGNVVGQTGALAAVRGTAPAAGQLAKEAAIGGTAGVVGGTTQEVSESPTLAAVAEIGTALSPAAARGVLTRTAPGKMLKRAQAEERLAANTAAAQEEMATTRQTMQTEVDALVNMREQTQNTLRAFGEEMQQLTKAQKGQAAQEVAALRSQAREKLTVIETEMAHAAETARAVQEGLQVRLLKETAMARQAATGARTDAATTAREWVRKLPTPTDTEIEDLYTKVASHKFLLPTDLLTQAQQQIGTKIETVRRFFPKASFGEMERMATAPKPLPDAAPPPTPELELQQFIRKQGGIRLTGEELGEELQAVISPRETGTTGLMNQRGVALSQMAERAAEAGYIPTADKGELLQALNTSLRTGNVFSSMRSDLVDELGDFFDRSAGLAPAMPTEMTFQEAKTLLTWLGQRIGSLRKATTPDAGEQLGAAKQLYSKVQATLDRAIVSGDLPPQAKADLQQANAAYKVKATVEALADEIEDAISIRPGEFDLVFAPGKVLDALRKGKDGAFLRTRLQEVGLLERVGGFLTREGAQIRRAAQNVPATRQAIQDELRTARKQARDQTEVLKQQKVMEQEALAQQEAQVAQGAEAAQATLGTEKAEVSKQLRSGVQQTRFAEEALKREQGATEQRLQGRIEAERAALPPEVKKPSLGVWGTGLGLSAWYANPLGLAITAPVLIARALMTPPGQKVLARFLAANNGTLDAAQLQALAAIVLRDTELRPQQEQAE